MDPVTVADEPTDSSASRGRPDPSGTELPLGPLAERRGVRLLEASPERVLATMPVGDSTQPYGLLHGGASVVLADEQDRRVCTARITCALVPAQRA
jgi:acyl-coenzyme A thioesterase PaaI-like protein